MKVEPVVRAGSLALAMGVAGDVLLRTHPWGLNAAVWFTILAGSMFAVRSEEAGQRKWAAILGGCAVLFAVLMLWRDAWGLRVMNVILCFFFISLSAAVGRGVHVLRATPLELAQQLLWNGVDTVFSPPACAAKRIKTLSNLDSRTVTLTKSYGRGVLFAVPVVAVFGALFASADPVFEGYVSYLFGVRWQTMVQHGFFVMFYVWLSAGVLLLFAIVKRRPYLLVPPAIASRMGVVETNTVLFLVASMFAAFVLIQIQYFFGGHAHVLETEGLTVADYARRGFFELSAVAALTMGLLIVADACTAASSNRGRNAFCAFAISLIGMVFVVLFSAFQKMALYVDLFGLTVLRVWVTIAIIGFAVLFVWQAATILTKRGHRFTGGAVAIGFLVAIALQLVNPDALTVRTNANRAASGSAFDLQYALRMSADAYPVLLDSESQLGEADQRILREHFAQKALELQADDWRSWNWSRRVARNALARMLEDGFAREPASFNPTNGAPPR